MFVIRTSLRRTDGRIDPTLNATLAEGRATKCAAWSVRSAAC